MLTSCPSCSTRLQVTPALAGRKVNCPRCGEVVTFPVDSSLQNDTLSPPTPARFAFLAAPHTPDEIGRLAHFRILGVLGEGGMGVVFRAEDAVLGRPVALKVMKPGMSATQENRERFLREARAMAAVEHDHVIAVHQVGEDRGVPFLAMPLLRGESLDDRLKREGRLHPLEAARIGLEMAEGLTAAHERGLIHRDIKPANVWLEGERRRVKLLDFGLARTATGSDGLTIEGAVMGTPGYMSPEQASGEPPDARSDLFALGCVLYRLCTGRPAFHGKDPIATLMQTMIEEPPPLATLAPDTPAWLAALIGRLLSKQATGRPASARAIADGLRAGWAGSATPVEATLWEAATQVDEPPPLAEPAEAKTVWPWRPLAIAGASLLVLAMGLGVALWLALSGGRSPTTVAEETKPAEQTPSVFATASALRREDVPEIALANAGDGDPKRAPAELVAVLGDARFRLTGIPHYPDFRRLLAVPSGSEVLLFDSETGRRLRALRGHTGRVRAVSFHPDGKRIASCSEDTSIRVWEVDTGRELQTLWGHIATVVGLGWTADGSMLAASSDDGSVSVWSMRGERGGGQFVRRLTAERGGDWAPTWSPDGAWLAVPRWGFMARFDAKTGEELAPLQRPNSRLRAENVRFSPDGKLFAFGDGERVEVWDAGGLKNHWMKPSPGAFVAFDRDGKTLLTAARGASSQEFTVTRRSVLDGEAVTLVKLPRRDDWGYFGLSPDSATLATLCDRGRTVYLCDARTGKPRIADPGHDRAGFGLAWSADGRYIASGDSTGMVILWEAGTGKPVRRLEGHTSAIYSLCFSPDGSTVVASAVGGLALVWETATGEVRQRFSGLTSMSEVAITPDGKTLFSGSPDGTVRARNLKTGSDLPSLDKHAMLTRSVAVSRDGKLVASGDERGVILVWDRATRRQLHRFERKAVVGKLRFSPDGQTLAAGYDHPDCTVRLWNLRTEEVTDLVGHTHYIQSVDFSPDGRWLLSASQDGTVRLWDVRSATPRQMVFWAGGLSEWGRAAAFSPDGGHLAMWCADGTVQVWRLPRDVSAWFDEQVPPTGLAEVEWLRRLETLTPANRARAVGTRLAEQNPGFDGRVTFEVHDGQVARLAFSSAAVSRLEALRGVPTLETLDCVGTVNMRDGRIADLTPLRDLKRLRWLNVGGNGDLTDISPLAGLPLQNVRLTGTRVTDLGPLKGTPLAEIWVSQAPGQELDTQTLKQLPVQRINGRLAADFWKDQKP